MLDDYITCLSTLTQDMRRRLHTERVVCATMVPIDGRTVPVLCPSCGSRVI